jgi:hypothetical protein
MKLTKTFLVSSGIETTGEGTHLGGAVEGHALDELDEGDGVGLEGDLVRDAAQRAQLLVVGHLEVARLHGERDAGLGELGLHEVGARRGRRVVVLRHLGVLLAVGSDVRV